MADGEEKDIKMARFLAFVHIIVGFLLVGLGTAVRVLEYYVTGYGYYGIWIGDWMCITGCLGILGTHKERSPRRDAFAGLFMGFTISSVVFGVKIIIIYSRGIDSYKKMYLTVDFEKDNYYSRSQGYNTHYEKRNHNHETQMALMVLILILGIVEVFAGIVATLCMFLIKPWAYCSSTPPQQGDDDLVLVQTVDTGSEGSPTQMATEPASRALGYQPHPVKAVTSSTTSEAMTTVCQPQKDDMPQFAAAVHGRYTRPRNEQEPLKI